MTTLRAIVEALRVAADAGEHVVLATVVRVVGSSYGGVGARMLARVDGTTVGLVSGGCLESDLADIARRVHASGIAEVATYDTRADDDAVWGLGLGCNGLIEVLLEPLGPDAARDVAALLRRALSADAPCALATVVRSDRVALVGHRVLVVDGEPFVAREPQTAPPLHDAILAHAERALHAGRRGLWIDVDGTEVAFEVVTPTVPLVVCGSGPDAVPVARLGVDLGWDVTVVDHRPVAHARPERFPGAGVVECADPTRLADVVALRPGTAAVVMSHHFARDADYLASLLAADVAYVGVLGPRSRTERMLAELATRGAGGDARDRLYGPVGLDVGGDGPEAIALAVIAEASAVVNGRVGGHLRDRRAPLHTAATPARVAE